MKNQEMLDLLGNLEKVEKLEGIKFAYAISKNKRIINNEIETMREIFKSSEDFVKYEKERIILCEKYCKKDEKGERIIKDNQYQIENQEAFDKDVYELKEKYKETIEQREKQIKEYNEFLNEESKVELFKIKLENIPENITTEQLDSIYDIIEE